MKSLVRIKGGIQKYYKKCQSCVRSYRGRYLCISFYLIAYKYLVYFTLEKNWNHCGQMMMIVNQWSQEVQKNRK